MSIKGGQEVVRAGQGLDRNSRTQVPISWCWYGVSDIPTALWSSRQATTRPSRLLVTGRLVSCECWLPSSWVRSGHLGYDGVNYEVKIPGIELFFANMHLHSGPAPVRRFLPDLIQQIWDRKIDRGARPK